MKLIILILSLWVPGGFCEQYYDYEEPGREVELRVPVFKSGLYPKPGDLPLLNRKIFRGMRVTIQEHPYVVSIRRNYVHFLTGTIISKSLIITVAHPLFDVPLNELEVVVGENYADRGTVPLTIVLVIIHESFNPYTLQGDIAMIQLFENLNFRPAAKPVKGLYLSTFPIMDQKAFVTGWGRCDLTGRELCLPRSSIYYPDEKFDPMLRTVSLHVGNNSQSHCDKYKRLFDLNLKPGMLCLGNARETNSIMPCSAVPGAPLVIDAQLLGILSWGLGCGYNNDLPLIYSDIRYYFEWIYHNSEVLFNVSKSDFTQLYEATKAYILTDWFIKTRASLNVHDHFEEDLLPLEIDKRLAYLKGSVYDIRNFVYNKTYHYAKVRLYSMLRAQINRTERLQNLMTDRPPLVVIAFTSIDSEEMDYEDDNNPFEYTTEMSDE